jgi:hypothetical protein
MMFEYWTVTKDGDSQARALFGRHYSFRAYKDNRPHKLFVGPGQKMVLITARGDALFVWRKFKDDSGQTGVNCAVFRNESKTSSSLLIKEAVVLAQKRWPGERLYTYVNPRKIKSTNPGYCFQRAGWKKCGRTKKGLIILEAKAGE